MTTRSRRAVACACVAAVLLASGLAAAHALGLSVGSYLLQGTRVRATLILRTDDAALAVSGLDSDGDGQLSQLELTRARPRLEADFVDALTVEADGEPCHPTLDEVTQEPPDGLSLRATYDCPREPTSTPRSPWATRRPWRSPR